MKGIITSYKNGFYITLLILLYTTGGISVTLLAKQPNLDIPLILFSIFEFLAAILATSICISHIHAYLKTMQFLYTFSIAASTILGIYWINNIIFVNLFSNSLYLRQLKVSFSTLFIVSMIFKPLVILSYFKHTAESFEFKDIESEPLESFTKNKLLGLKKSLQTLVSEKEYDSEEGSKSEKSSIDNILHDLDINNTKLETNLSPNHNMLKQSNLVLDSEDDLGHMTPTYVVTRGNENQMPTTETVILPDNQFQDSPQTMKHYNFPYRIPEETETETKEENESIISESTQPDFITTPSKMTSNCGPYTFCHGNISIDPNKISGYNDSKKEKENKELNNEYIYDDDAVNKVQLLNIPEHNKSIWPQMSSSKSSPIRNNLNNISLDAWNENSEKWMNQRERTGFPKPLFHSTLRSGLPPLLVRSHSDSENISKTSDEFFQMMNKEIKDNDPNSSNAIMNKSFVDSHDTLTRLSQLQLKNKSSTDAIIKTASKKSLKHSLSLHNISRKPNADFRKSFSISRSRSSTLNSQHAPASPQKSRSSSPFKRLRSFKETLKRSDSLKTPSISTENEDYDFDIELVKSIQNSPKKKNSFSSISSQRLKLMSSIITEKSPQMGLLMSPIHMKTVNTKLDNLNFFTGNEINLDLTDSSAGNDTSDKINMSDSEGSRLSIPSACIGEYDREKWSAIKNKLSIDVGLKHEQLA